MRRFWWLWIILLLLVIIFVVRFLRVRPSPAGSSSTAATAGGTSSGAGSAGGAPVPTLVTPPATGVPNIPVAWTFNTSNPGCTAPGTGTPAANNAFQLNLSQSAPAPNQVTFVPNTPGWVPGQPLTTLNFAFDATDQNPSFPTAGDPIQVTTTSTDPLMTALVQALNGHLTLDQQHFLTADLDLSSWVAWMTAHSNQVQGQLQFVEAGNHSGAFHCGGPVTIGLTINLVP